MGLFNAGAPFYADLNLLLQIFTFVLLVGGAIIAKFKRVFNKHAMVMSVAVALNTFSIAVVMIPSLLSFRGLLSAPFSHPALVVIVHMVTGTLVEILGIWFVVTWALSHRGTASCARMKNRMRATALLWLVELFQGIYVYIMLYVQI